MKNKIIISSIFFIFLFTAISIFLSKIITNEGDWIQRDVINSFYKEKENSLDVVVIGPSSTFCSWIPLIVWKKYGITNLTYSSPGLPNASLKYIIQEILKTQKPKLLIINIDGIAEFPSYTDSTCVDIHRFLFNMKFSPNKISTIYSIIKFYKLSFINSLEFFFPIIRFHKNWKNIKQTVIKKIQRENYPKGIFTQINPEYYTLKNKNKINTKIIYKKSSYNVPQEYIDYLNDFYSYLSNLQTPVLLINTPILPHMESEMMYNRHEKFFDTAFDLAKKYNIDYIDIRQKRSSMFTEKDYFDPGHLNFLGACKYINYLANIIINKYKFIDNKNNILNDDWNKAYIYYADIIKEKYGVDIEEVIKDNEIIN